MESSREKKELYFHYIVFRNRKWNYVNRKWKFFSHLWSSDQKTSLIKVSSFCLTILKWFPETIALLSLNYHWLTSNDSDWSPSLILGVRAFQITLNLNHIYSHVFVIIYQSLIVHQNLFIFIINFNIGTTGLFIISCRIFASVHTGTGTTVFLHSPIARRTR